MKRVIINYLAPTACVLYFVIAIGNMVGCKKVPEPIPGQEKPNLVSPEPEPRIKYKESFSYSPENAYNFNVSIIEVDGAEYIISRYPITKLENLKK